MNNGQLTLGSLFDGIGGFPYAASFYGIRALWASEIIPECISVTRRHFPDMEHVGDITKLHGGTLPPVDIITFGSPLPGFERGVMETPRPCGGTERPLSGGDPDHQRNEGGDEWRIPEIRGLGKRPRRFVILWPA